MLNENYLLLLFLMPIITTVVVAVARGKAAPWISTILAGAYFIFVLLGLPVKELSYTATWFGDLTYGLYLDSYSYYLILLSAFLTLLSLVFSLRSIKDKVVAYHALFHALQATVVGSLLCDDLLFFYVFWEAMLIPMYFIIGIWGGARRHYATLKFFLYTFAGSLLMLVGMIALYVIYYRATGMWTFSFQNLRGFLQHNPLDLATQQIIFAGFLLSFAIKVPLFPFHTWLPDAHVEAPTAGSVILAGVLLKMGTYGMMRFAIPLFPDAAQSFSSLLCLLSVIGIILGALVAWRQTDIKKLIAYSSVSHLGFVTLGIFMMTEAGWNGAYMQMINHGISTGALFLLVGFIYDQAHTRDIKAFGGIAKTLPWFTLAMVTVSLSSMGLPGTNGFVGEFLILLGSFKSSIASPVWVVLAGSGVVLGAIYMLHLIQQLCYGKPRTDAVSHLHDFGKWEAVLFTPLLFLVFFIGLFPETLLGPVREKTSQILSSISFIAR